MVPFVEAVEWSRRGVRDDATVNQHAGMAALLHGYLGNAGQRMSVLIERRRASSTGRRNAACVSRS
jgi:hypothetical protein